MSLSYGQGDDLRRLTPRQLDALREVANIGAGHAATALSQMTEQRIMISVPQLSVAAIYFDRELESRIKKFTTMFEPIMIVFVGVIVGFVAMALVSAMYGVLGSTKEQI